MTVVTAPTISQRIEGAFNAASRSTGTSFDYLLRTASRESSLDPQAQARTSSASGLFQFIESTWLEMIKEAGPHLGFERYAQHIERTGNSRYRVKDAEKRAEILELRNDPEAASLMAGAYTQKNEARLTNRLGRAPTAGELYIAHFLGARGAEKLIRAAEDNPQQNAAQIFPRQARANRAIFYGPGGQARSASEVRSLLVNQHGDGAVMTAKSAPAGAPAEPAPRVLMSAFAPASDVNNRVAVGWQAAQSNAPFNVLFRTDPSLPRDPVGPSFWSAFASSPDMLEGSAAPRPVAADRRPATEMVQRHTIAEPAASAQAAPEPVQAAQSSRRRPLNLTEFLSYSPAREPRNLLPPA